MPMRCAYPGPAPNRSRGRLYCGSLQKLMLENLRAACTPAAPKYARVKSHSRTPLALAENTRRYRPCAPLRARTVSQGRCISGPSLSPRNLTRARSTAPGGLGSENLGRNVAGRSLKSRRAVVMYVSCLPLKFSWTGAAPLPRGGGSGDQQAHDPSPTRREDLG